MRRVLATAVSAAILLSSGSAFARDAYVAKLIDVKGSVLVDAGNGYTTVTGSTRLKVGDSVRIADGSKAVLSYGPNCGMALPAGSVTKVSDASCVVGTQGGSPTFFERFRPLGWGILSGIITFIVAAI